MSKPQDDAAATRVQSSEIGNRQQARPVPRIFDLVADEDGSPEMELLKPNRTLEAQGLPQVINGADLSGKRKIIFWVGRGKTGKTTGIRWLAETAMSKGTTLFMADMDPTNDTFSRYIENVSRPPEASDPILSLKWLDRLLQHSLQEDTSLLVDLGGGDTTLRRLVTQLPDFVDLFEAQGFAVVLIFTVGPQEEDLSPLATLQNLKFRPSATAVILNEAMVEVGDTRDAAFGRIFRHSAFRDALSAGAVPVFMPRLLPAQQVEIRRLKFRDAADGLKGRANAPLSPFDRMRVRLWLEAMDRNFAGITSWLA